VRYEVEPITWALRVYDDARTNDDDYIASALVRKYGDRGWMSSISSPRLFDALATPGQFAEFLDRLGVVCVEGYMSESMARALRMAASRYSWCDFYVARRGLCAGRTMPWVVLKKFENLEEDK
jgi:hypothetical protein